MSLLRCSTLLSLFGSVVLSGLASISALALPEAQIVEKLGLPVFTLTDQKGSPLVAPFEQNGNKITVAGVFISHRDAQAFLERLKKENASSAKNVEVVAVSLADVYQMQKQQQANPNGLRFEYVANEQQIQIAKKLLSDRGQKPDDFAGVPLFVLKGKGNQGYLMFQWKNEKGQDQQVIPFFFSKEDLQKMFNAFKAKNPQIEASTEVQVVNLEGIMRSLQEDQNPELNKILLVPPTESIEFVRILTERANSKPRP